MKSKACLSEESQSDHMTLLRAFQGWQESGNAGDFCTGYNLSQVMLFDLLGLLHCKPNFYFSKILKSRLLFFGSRFGVKVPN